MSEKPRKRLVGRKQYIGNIAARVLGRSVAGVLLAAGLACFGFSIFVVALWFGHADLTFGYQHVTLDAAGWHLFGGHADVAEADCAGITGLSRKGKRTLVIDYCNPTQNGDDKDSLFVAQDRRWGDVQILYNNGPGPDSAPPSVPPKSQSEPGKRR